MQVRKFEAPTMQEALGIVKQELGPDAIILSTKNNRKGFGLLSKASVEITAAISEKDLNKKKITEKVLPTDVKEQIKKLPATKQAKIYNEFSDHYQQRINNKNTAIGKTTKYIDIKDDDFNPASLLTDDSSIMNTQSTGYKKYPTNNATQHKIDQIVKEYEERIQDQFTNSKEAQQQNSGESLNAIKSDINKLKEIIEELKFEQITLSDSKAVESLGSEMTEEFNSLLRNGIDRKFATQLIRQASFSLPKSDHDNTEKVLDAIALEMMQNVRVDHLLQSRPGTEQRVYAFFGPTGVGKTTTIAKIASLALLTKNLKVGLVNIDSYRVGASDQLSTYAKILNVPFRNATSSQELERILNELKPMDLVLIDTTGRSQKDQDSLVEMKKMIGEFNQIRALLVLSSTTRDQELYDIINRFKMFSPQSLVFSKLDESSVYGCIYNVAIKTGLPISYFTMGQRVPEDIEAASVERVVDLIMNI